MHSILLRFSSLAFLLLVLASGCVTDADVAAERKCHSYLLMPPVHDDELASEEVQRAWLLSLGRPRLRSCDRIITPEAAKEALQFVGISHGKDNTPSEISQPQAQHLAERTGATHLVFINYHVDKEALKMRSAVYLVQPWRHVSQDPLQTNTTATLAKNSLLREALPTRWLAYGFSLLPNVVEAGYSEVDVFNLKPQNDSSVQLLSQTQHSVLPPFLSSIATESIRHPEEFGRWGAAFDIKGNLAFLSIDNTYVFTLSHPVAGNEPTYTTKNYGLGLYMLVPSINAVLSTHTPIGTTSFGAGIGPALYSYRDTEDHSGLGIIPILRLSLAHTMFFSDRWFVRLAYTGYFTPAPLKPIVSTDVFIFGDAFEALLALGFYYPEARSSARSLSL